MYDQSEFNRMIDEAMNRKDAPAVKTIEDRRQERKQPLQPKPTDENVQKEEEVTTQKKKPFDKDETLGDSTTKTTIKAKQRKESTTDENVQKEKEVPTDKKKKKKPVNKEDQENKEEKKEAAKRKSSSEGEGLVVKKKFQWGRGFGGQEGKVILDN